MECWHFDAQDARKTTGQARQIAGPPRTRKVNLTMAIILAPDVARKVLQPGPQPCNQIGTLFDSLRRVMIPRRRRPDHAPATMADIRRLRERVRTLERITGGMA